MGVGLQGFESIAPAAPGAVRFVCARPGKGDLLAAARQHMPLPPSRLRLSPPYSTQRSASHQPAAPANTQRADWEPHTPTHLPPAPPSPQAELHGVHITRSGRGSKRLETYLESLKRPNRYGYQPIGLEWDLW